MPTRHLWVALCLARTSTINSRLVKILAVSFWLLIWHIGAVVIGERILLVSPITVVIRLFELIVQKRIWTAALFSTLRIALGFFLAVASALILAPLAVWKKWIGILIEPVAQAFKVIPVASITIVVLIWVSSRNLSVIISFMMVFPVLYTNLLSSINSTDAGMLEVAKIYRLGVYRKLRLVYLPQVYPTFLSSSSLCLGLAWKSGVAAEVIGIPNNSLGEMLYEAKLYFATADLFAYTLLIVLLSVGFEQLMRLAIKKAGRALEAV